MTAEGATDSGSETRTNGGSPDREVCAAGWEYSTLLGQDKACGTRFVTVRDQDGWGVNADSVDLIVSRPFSGEHTRVSLTTNAARVLASYLLRAANHNNGLRECA